MKTDINDTLVKRSIDYLKRRLKKIEDGGINTIPSPFKRFSEDFIGIEQGKYYLVTGQTKSGKSQIASFIFVYNSLMYYYYNPTQVKIQIFYYPLEETPEEILYRFMSYYLCIKTNGKIKVSPEDLKSSKTDKPISKDILDLLESEEYIKIFNFFEEHIIFSASRNPTGIYNEVKAFMKDNGTVHYKQSKIKDEFGNIKEIQAFDYYEPNDPDLYTIVIVDHISLITPEKVVNTNQTMTLKQAIDKVSEYCVILRNRYNVTPVIVQQQSVESESNDSIKLGRVRPSIGNLSDSKYTAKDANVVLGIFSPYRFELSEYLGYNTMILKDNFRLLEVIINRGGSPGGTIGLYFNGKCNYFKELPLPNTNEIKLLYDKLTNKTQVIHKALVSYSVNKINNNFVKSKLISKFATLFSK